VKRPYKFFSASSHNHRKHYFIGTYWLLVEEKNFGRFLFFFLLIFFSLNAQHYVFLPFLCSLDNAGLRQRK